jgi:DNA-binding CsgD family transcriptional regulator
MATSLRNGLYGFEMREDDRRRVAPGERKTHDIQQLWQVNHEIVNLASLGYKQVEIARILNITPQTVSNTLNSTLGENKSSELREVRDGEVKVRLEQVRILTEKAIGVYHEILDNEKGDIPIRDRKDTADNILMELSGLRVPTKIQSQSSMTILNTTEISEFKRRGIAAMREAGLVASAPEPKQIEVRASADADDTQRLPQSQRSQSPESLQDLGQAND